MTSTEPTPPAKPARTTRAKTLQEAAIAYAAAKLDVDSFDGRKDSAEFAALVGKWRAALFELDAASIRTHAQAAADLTAQEKEKA